MKWLLLIIYLLVLAGRLGLRRLNLRHLERHGDQVPAPLAGVVDRDLLARTSAYTLAKDRLGLIETLVGSLLLIIVLFCGPLAWYDSLVRELTGSFIGQGLLFVFGLLVAQFLLDLPFNAYRTFVLEERFGFNTTTPRLWLADLGKSLLVGGLLAGLATAGALAIVQASPNFWWLWAWLFFLIISITLMYLSPVLIEPLFFKFEPLQRPELVARVKALMSLAGLRVDRVLQVDASRRSKHSNAYFTGIGRVKRIVLFDTLLAQMNDDELLAVLAHEAGHWQLGHIWKRLLLMEVVSLAVCWLAWVAVGWDVLPALFGIAELGFMGQILLFMFLLNLVLFPLTPLFSALSRRHEWQADRFAVHLTDTPAALADALAKLARENLSNLHPHPWYAWFYYSHPPVTARCQRLINAGAATTS